MSLSPVSPLQFTQNTHTSDPQMHRNLPPHTKQFSAVPAGCPTIFLSFSRSVMVQLLATLWTAAHQASLSITTHHLRRVCSNSCPLSQWCLPTISSSVVRFYCFQSFPASGSFLTTRLFTWPKMLY